MHIYFKKYKRKQRILDLHKEYAHTFFSIRKLSSYFRTIKTKKFKNIFLNKMCNASKLPIKIFFDNTEFRLDILLIRANFVSSLYYARWLISSGFVSLNGIVCYRSSTKVNTGNNIKIKKLCFFKNYFFNLSTFKLPPEYLEINYNILSFILIKISHVLNEQKIAKQYSFFLYEL